MSNVDSAGTHTDFPSNTKSTKNSTSHPNPTYSPWESPLTTHNVDPSSWDIQPNGNKRSNELGGGLILKMIIRRWIWVIWNRFGGFLVRCLIKVWCIEGFVLCRIRLGVRRLCRILKLGRIIGMLVIQQVWYFSSLPSPFAEIISFLIFPLVTVSFPLVDDPTTSLLAWTTTPWTLPSNLGLCVHPDFDYIKIHDETRNENFILFEGLLTTLYKDPKKAKFKKVATYKGDEMKGWRYQPLFDYFTDKVGVWRFSLSLSP